MTTTVRGAVWRGLRRRPGGALLGVLNRPDLIARAYGGTDKVTHGYMPYYALHLGPLRMRRNTVLEIGIGSPADVDSPQPGGSLKMWRDYFPRSVVGALDLTPKDVGLGERVRVFQADQSSAADLARVADALGPLDIVIDDGSHVGRHQVASFEFLFPRLTAGGWYVVEDLHTSYWPDFEGEIPAPECSGVGLVKTACDSAQSTDRTFDLGWGPVPDFRYPGVAEVHVYPGIAFVRKSTTP